MQSVLVTGANRGIGLEFVRQLITNKHPKHVFAGCRNVEEAEVLKQLAEENPSLKVIRLDVTNDESIDEAVKEVASVVGGEGLDVLINNAGLLIKEPLQNATRDNMQDHFNVNCSGPLIVTKKFLPLLKKGAARSSSAELSCRNAVINLTSGHGSISENTSGGAYAYRASKAALQAVTKSLSIDLKPDNILAVSLGPGWVLTDMGGPNASLTAEASVSAMIETMDKLGEEENGLSIKYNGTIVPF